MNCLPSGLLTLLMALNLLIGCSARPTDLTTQGQSSTNTNSREPLDITVSIVPQEYFVEKVGGDRVEVNVMVQPGASPATYEPKPQQLKDLSQAKAYVSIGVPFEKAWMGKIQGANSQMRVIDSARGIGRMGNDPHIWLSPPFAKVQAQNIYQGLVDIDPENQAIYRANLDQFLIEIDQLDRQIKQNLAGVKNRKFIVFHPSWSYFARNYDLEQVPIEVGGQEPSAAELGELIENARVANIKVIFAQPEFSTQSAKTIAQEIGGEVLLVTPLSPDWSNNLLRVSQTFAKVLNKEGNRN